jgi:DNA repair photolyase
MISEKEFKSPLKFPGSGYEMVTCHYPLRLDVYSGCAHDCVYCYAGLMLRARGMWNPQAIRVADVNEIEKAFENAFSGKGWSPISQALRHKLPVRLGGLTDCFQKCELEAGTALKLLKLLNKYDYPFMIVTKSDVVAQKEYLKEIAKGKGYVQITIISLDSEALKKIEPGAPEVSARIDTIRKLSSKGVFVAARLSPVIPILSTDHLNEYVKTMAKAGARHILAEFFRGKITMIQRIEDLTGISFMDVMEKKGTYRRVNVEYKNRFYTKLKSMCDKMSRTMVYPH